MHHFRDGGRATPIAKLALRKVGILECYEDRISRGMLFSLVFYQIFEVFELSRFGTFVTFEHVL